MPEMQQFLKKIISTSGLSGYEGPVRRIIEEAWRPLVDEISVSRVGSLYAFRHGLMDAPRSSLLLAAHMDAIGLMVSGINGEFLRITEIGGLDQRVLPGQIVTVHGREDIPGLVIQPPSHLLPPDNRNGSVKIENLFVDTGLPAEELGRLVRPGDLISFAQLAIDLSNEVLVGHSLDNRASIACVTQCLLDLVGRPLCWDLWAVATTQEEETFAGAYTSAYELRPTLAVAIDVTFASSPGSPSHKTFPMGKGITLCWGPNIHPGLFKKFKDLASRLEIPYSVEVTPRHSGTDAYGLQVAAEGVPTMVVSLPLRYMHTPVEMISMKDVLRLGRLLAEFAASLDEDFMPGLGWDD